MKLDQVFNICLQTECQIAQHIYNDEELKCFTFYTNASFKTCYLVDDFPYYVIHQNKQNPIISCDKQYISI